jgi:hypothetical protein
MAHGSRVDPTMTGPLLRTTLAIVLAAILQPAAARAQADAKDWPMYNSDVLGSRYNRGEKAIGRDNAGRLEEEWRFPAAGSTSAPATRSSYPHLSPWSELKILGIGDRLMWAKWWRPGRSRRASARGNA